MKPIIRKLVLAVVLIAGLIPVSAQQVQVLVTPKRTLPTTVTSYIDDPFRYFDIQFILHGSDAVVDVFFDINLTVSTSSMYVRTKPGTVPSDCIHLSPGLPNSITGEMIGSQLPNDRLEYDLGSNNGLSLQQLPEGVYTLCVDVYLWSDRMNPQRQPITMEPHCTDIEICYSGSAPELVSPLAGAELDLNGTMVVAPDRKVKFIWTPVMSNCSGKNVRFNYQLKVVKVLDGQNYQDAIRYNPTVFSAEVRDNFFVVLDTLRDVKVQMEEGALYVAQVMASDPISTSREAEAFVVANGGVSQPMPFFWGTNENSSRYYVANADEEDAEEGDESEGVEGLTLWEGGVEEVSELEDILERAYPYEQTIVLNPKRHFVVSDGYYTIPATDDIEVGFRSARHKSLKNVSHTLGLYNYIRGGVDSITSHEPLFSEKMAELPESRTFAGWGDGLKQGNLYYLQLEDSYTVGYWKYLIADTNFYVNERLAQHVHDTVSREFVEEEQSYVSGVYFQWGDNPAAKGFAAPQWKAPVDRTGDDIYDPMNYKLPTSAPEVRKAGTFPVSWTPVKNVTKGDTVTYKVNVYEVKAGQTMEEAIYRNKVLASRTLTNTHEIAESDKDFFKVFSPKKTYVMTLSTDVDGESDTVYHFGNGNEAMPVVFKIVK